MLGKCHGAGMYLSVACDVLIECIVALGCVVVIGVVVPGMLFNVLEREADIWRVAGVRVHSDHVPGGSWVT